MSILRGECKTAGGKLVAVNVTVDDADDADGRTVTDCRLDGDFFIDGDDDAAQGLIGAIERALTDGERIRPVIERYATVTGVRLVGVDAASIETAFARATGADDRPVRLRLARHDGGETASGRPDDGAGPLTPSVGQCPTAPPIRGRKEVLGPDGRSGRSTDEEDEENQAFERRWAGLHPTVIHDVPREPADQMTVDEQWAREVASGKRPATIRFWEWASPAVVVGRYQSIRDEVHEDAAVREGFSVVRRCTGGGAMFIEPGNTITYSLYAPLPFVAGIGVEESYRLCDRWLIGALRELGIAARFAGINDIASDRGKIGGAAQRRFPGRDGGPGAVLHHVTLAYDIDADKMGRVLNVSQEKLSDKAVRSARRRVDPMRTQTGLDREEIVRRLVAYLREPITI
ncbi:lipoate--protein ligase family protein [Bifidobacterium aerophilum]|uniref:Lipoate--protein ligase family protein n=1 Tax=Bifidobacterium aerophilum TaxID=1798155 RepID=A0A6N9Z561_9BIFI|nr:lipoate--protein ligase family protein [Bifidobacterium aerophilum]NEG89772.1 lipoate--protein ligase family protein [Bifidobacterium aerophilum]